RKANDPVSPGGLQTEWPVTGGNRKRPGRHRTDPLPQPAAGGTGAGRTATDHSADLPRDGPDPPGCGAHGEPVGEGRIPGTPGQPAPQEIPPGENHAER